MLNNEIKFISQYADLIEHPIPIKKVVPNWYKELTNHTYSSNHDDINNLTTYTLYMTVKQCQPVLDSVTMGYAILSPIDFMFVKTKDPKEDIFKLDVVPARWNDAESLERMNKMNIGISDHTNEQINKSMVYPDEIPMALKFLNPWYIKTPPGYSCLFTSPFNTEKKDFRLVTGIVDTDVYENYVNFPFFVRDWDSSNNQTKILKKGEPICLVFPFKRDDWKMNVVKDDKLRDKLEFFNIKTLTSSFNAYKNKIWKKKNYK
jgi:hypothetical protein|tara:strand:- start:2111 stop:2893 length:783 start_codon:yes stop_codon:yes gene_type:complete